MKSAVTLAHFQMLGNSLVAIDRFNNFVIGLVWFPALKSAVTLAHFQMLGNSLVAIDRFNNFVIDGVIVREAHFSKRALILSNPMALLH